MNLSGRTVLITGAARGIGTGTAQRMHARGANVALVGIEPELLERRAAELGGDRAAWFEADVTDVEALGRAVDGVVERFGGIDVAIANAGVHYVGAFRTSPLDRLEREIEVNLMGVLRTDHAVLPHLVRSRGYLLNVASLAAAAHAPLMSSYSASKAGVEALTNCLRTELASTGATAGCAYFGFIDTDMVRDAFAHPSTQVAAPAIPAFVRRSVPVDRAVDAIERAVDHRSARTWAPRYVGAALAIRGIFQPIAERRIVRDRRLAKALDLVGEPEAAPAAEQAPVAAGERA